MSYLEKLKTLVAESFKDANDKTTIENAAKINDAINEIQREQDKLMAKNTELAQAYKEAVLHTSVKPNPNIQDTTNATGGQPISMEAFLDDWTSKNK